MFQRQIESIEAKLQAKSMECYKQDIALGVLSKEKSELAIEIERLRSATELAKASAIASLPSACFADLTSSGKV